MGEVELYRNQDQIRAEALRDFLLGKGLGCRVEIVPPELLSIFGGKGCEFAVLVAEGEVSRASEAIARFELEFDPGLPRERMEDYFEGEGAEPAPSRPSSILEREDCSEPEDRRFAAANSIVEALGKALGDSLAMLSAEIEACPDWLWTRKVGGFPFYQQVFHALHGFLYWTRPEGLAWVESFPNRRLYPELEACATDDLSKAEARALAAEAETRLDFFLEGGEAGLLATAPSAESGRTKLETLLLQARHLSYHSGHCDSCLREKGLGTGDWGE